MDFEWDDHKAEANETKHGVPFTFATRIFIDPDSIQWPDNRRDYGETRQVLLGLIEGRVYVVTYTTRKNIIRIISARKGNKREKKRYDRSLSD